MKTVKAGIVGLGGRGIGLLKQLVKMKDIEIHLKQFFMKSNFL